MKKSTIVILIVSAVMIVTGIGLFVGGLVSIGGVEAARRALMEHEALILDELDIDLDEHDLDLDFDSGRIRIDLDI